ncbi:unnamed protein product [Coccothraustes coccothraustes]
MRGSDGPAPSRTGSTGTASPAQPRAGAHLAISHLAKPFPSQKPLCACPTKGTTNFSSGLFTSQRAVTPHPPPPAAPSREHRSSLGLARRRSESARAALPLRKAREPQRGGGSSGRPARAPAPDAHRARPGEVSTAHPRLQTSPQLRRRPDADCRSAGGPQPWGAALPRPSAAAPFPLRCHSPPSARGEGPAEAGRGRRQEAEARSRSRRAGGAEERAAAEQQYRGYCRVRPRPAQ